VKHENENSALRTFSFALVISGLASASAAQQIKAVTATATAPPIVGVAVYENNFEKAELNKVPEDLLVLEGAFNVKKENGNKFLELPGAPLDTFGVLFGPTESSDLAVSARIYGTAKGRRFPTFGVGLNGVGGYKLQISPSKKALELSKGDEVLSSVPYSWESDSWTVLRLQVREVKASERMVEGKAWKQGGKEPGSWLVSRAEKTEPVAGRASVWGAPYAGTPIRFDDFVVTRLSDKP
jgi:hypothetical protein